MTSISSTLASCLYLQVFEKVRLLHRILFYDVKRNKETCWRGWGGWKQDFCRDETTVTARRRAQKHSCCMISPFFLIRVIFFSFSCWLKLALICLITVSGAKMLPHSPRGPPLKILFNVCHCQSHGLPTERLKQHTVEQRQDDFSSLLSVPPTPLTNSSYSDYSLIFCRRRRYNSLWHK